MRKFWAGLTEHWRHHWALWLQGLLLLGIFSLGLWFWGNLSQNFARRNFSFGFDFLGDQAGLPIKEPFIAYKPTDTYLKALWVGLLNTLRVSFFSLLLASSFGVTIGIARLSSNWLVKKLALIYVEVLRNTPLLLQLFFWYAVLFLALPRITDPVRWPSDIFLSIQGIVVPWFRPTEQASIWLVGLLVGLLLALSLGWYFRRRRIEAGQITRVEQLLPIAISMVSLLIVMGLTKGHPPLLLDRPQWSLEQGMTGGFTLTAEFTTLMMGLSLYTAAFIAEIVRAGITSVPKGQWEAAKSIGLKPSDIMVKIIFPQAMRVILPPLTSQYLNLVKNSSLAIAIGYSDLYSVSSTTLTQTGHSIEVILLLMGAYLAISLSISVAMNFYNRKTQWATR